MESRTKSATAWYRRLSLRAELATGFIAVLALTLVVGFVSLFAQNHSIEAVDKLVVVVGRIDDLSLSSNVAMLKARRAEKDFLIFRNEFGFSEARSRYVTVLRTNIAEVRQHMAHVRELSGEPEVIDLTHAIEQAVGQYEVGFLRVVDLYGRRGHMNTGFEGKFRQKAHDIEAIVSAAHQDRLMVDLLTLRRHEKDFVARGIDKYVEAFAQGIDRFRVDLAQARLSPEVKRKLLGLTTDYKAWFEQYAEIGTRIDAEQTAYLAAAHTVEPLLEKLHANAELNADTTQDDAKRQAQIAIWAIGAAVLLASLLGLAVALIISRSITKSVDECIGFARRVSQGDLSTRLSPKGNSEFGTLAVALNRMTETLEERDAGLQLATLRINRLNRVYAVLSDINMLIVHVRDRDEVFTEACRIAVEDGRFQMAWIGVVDRSAMKIVPVASAGASAGFLEAVRERLSLLDSAPEGYGPPALAVREKQAVVVNDVEADPRIRNKTLHADMGIRSSVSLPLLVADEAVGVFCIHAAEGGYFDEAEMTLLRELAGNIAFAIDHLGKQEQLDYLAYYDELTGLANRGLFLERVTQYLRSAVSGGHNLAVFLIDLERFKNINDSLGRPAGDALLRQVAEWLTRNAAGDANLVARVGADQFAAVLPIVRNDGNVVRLLEKFNDAFLNHPFRLNDAVFRIAFKVGVALFPDDGTDADTLFRHAEAALKKAKASGERYLFYAQEMTAAVAGKLTLENQLRQALDNGEFVLHYQPKVNLATGRMTSAEALIRWNDPSTGLVPPGRFIPILEETGLIYDVGQWALRQAVADYLRWRAAGLAAVRIAVNVSPLQLRQRGFIAEVEQAIGTGAQAAAGLELEITESVIMQDVKHNIASLQAIRAMGVSIAIDDFGTGFSSLSYLAKLPVDTLKIDRSFVFDMTRGPQGMALVSTIINLAHSLKLKVVAEGVETDEQSRLLGLLDCDEMQGYLFSKPVPGEIFETRFLSPPRAG
ncbi:MAG: EAL domain-containing protein [Sulfuritalea sp.]|nr:EAL domain-containing protein [Sulfuritalea sp.]